MTNFLQETLEVIERSGHTLVDIIFIGSEDSGYGTTCWKEFTNIANIKYDSGFGAQEIASDLIIAFKDGFKMWRSEYDGSENWCFAPPFTMPEEIKPLKFVCVNQVSHTSCGWVSLLELHEEDEDEDY